MTTKKSQKMGKEEMKEMFDLVIYALIRNPRRNAKNVLKIVVTYAKLWLPN